MTCRLPYTQVLVDGSFDDPAAWDIQPVAPGPPSNTVVSGGQLIVGQSGSPALAGFSETTPTPVLASVPGQRYEFHVNAQDVLPSPGSGFIIWEGTTVWSKNSGSGVFKGYARRGRFRTGGSRNKRVFYLEQCFYRG